MHEVEDDDGNILVAWEDLPAVDDFPVAPLDDVPVGDLVPEPIVLDDDG